MMPHMLNTAPAVAASQQALALPGQAHVLTLDITSLMSLPTVAIDLTLELPTGPLIALHQAIRNAIPQPTQIVQFASAYAGEDVSQIAFETALVAATLVGKRVLFIDTGSETQGIDPQLAGAVHTSLDTLLQNGGSYHGRIVTVAGTRLSYAVLRGPENSSLTLAHPEAIKALLENLRQYFELIVIDSASLMSDVFGTLLARQVDGSVLVVAAEHTRAPVAVQTQRLIEHSGGRVIGTVLSRRKFHIPLWLYRLLYRNKTMI
jgi:Mrp family chromosome partitioning ATPase